MKHEDQLREDLAEIQEKMITINDEMEVIRGRYGTKSSNMPAGQAQRYENLLRAQERNIAQVEELQSRVDRFDEIRRNSARGYIDESEHDSPHKRARRGDPWKAEDDTTAGMISRAHSSLELMAGPATSDRNRLADMLDRDHPETGDFARYVVRASHPDYKTAWLKMIRQPQLGHLSWTDDEKRAWNAIYQDPEIRRTAMSLTDANGGYLVPFTLDPTVILTNSGIKDPIRQLARVEMTTTDTWNGVTSAGISAEWTAEATEWADKSPGFGAVTITPKKADAWVQGSFEVLSDSNFATQLARLMADAKARLEGAAFATGNSGATQPYGIVSITAAVTASIVSSAAINAFAIGDVYNVDSAITARAQGNVSWIASHAILNKIRQFDTTGSAAFWANLGQGVPPSLLGNPVYEVSSMQNAVTTSGLILLGGDIREGYLIVDRVGMTLLYEPLVKGSSRRPTGESGWAAFWRVGAGAQNADALRVLQLHTSPAAVALA